MKQPNFSALSTAELWELHEQVNRLLAEKLTSEKLKLERRFSMLSGHSVPFPVGGATATSLPQGPSEVPEP